VASKDIALVQQSPIPPPSPALNCANIKTYGKYFLWQKIIFKQSGNQRTSIPLNFNDNEPNLMTAKCIVQKTQKSQKNLIFWLQICRQTKASAMYRIHRFA
jgi:hypothetical protein